MEKTAADKQLINLTRTVIRSFYAGTVSLILKYLSSGIVWINSATGQCLYGYYPVTSSLFKLPRPAYSRIIYRKTHITQVSANSWAVTCEYSTFLDPYAVDIATYYCSTFIWKEEDRTMKLMYVHISPSRNPKPEPVLLSLQGRHAQVHRIPPEEILYVEASNIHSSIHCRSGCVDINQSISQLENLLPGYFMRTHRSFIVNKQYVRRIYRYGLELTTGIQLPVPQKRYMKVVCWLET